jgi:formyltetrahydrofolate synthetase
MRTMPGLSDHPAAEKIDIDDGQDRRVVLSR